MRFRSLKDLTSMPVEGIRHQFRNEEVRSVVPARLAATTTESLLVATTTALAIVTADPRARSKRWMTRWAPWDVVRLGGDIRSLGRPNGVEYTLDVRIDRLHFVSMGPGETGLRALRDFAAAARDRRSQLPARP